MHLFELSVISLLSSNQPDAGVIGCQWNAQPRIELKDSL